MLKSIKTLLYLVNISLVFNYACQEQLNEEEVFLTKGGFVIAKVSNDFIDVALSGDEGAMYSKLNDSVCLKVEDGGMNSDTIFYQRISRDEIVLVLHDTFSFYRAPDYNKKKAWDSLVVNFYDFYPELPEKEVSFMTIYSNGNVLDYYADSVYQIDEKYWSEISTEIAILKEPYFRMEENVSGASLLYFKVSKYNNGEAVFEMSGDEIYGGAFNLYRYIAVKMREKGVIKY